MTCNHNLDIRKRDLARIHMLKKDAGLDDETYRDMLEGLTGKRSCGKMNSSDRFKVIKHLQKSVSRKFKSKPKKKDYPGRPHNCNDKPQLLKIEALLADNRLPWSYADSILKRMYKKDKLAFASPKELSAVITALAKEFGDDYGK